MQVWIIGRSAPFQGVLCEFDSRYLLHLIGNDMKEYVPSIVTTCCALAIGFVAGALPWKSSTSEQVEPEREPFHGSFVCEYYGAKTSKIDNVVGYDVFDVGNNFGWNLTLADGAHMMYLQSADKFCYTIATKAPPTK